MSANLSDIAFSVVIKNDGISDIIFKTIMLKGDKGNSVDHVEKTSTSGLVDTYTIYLTDGTIGGTFTVTNGSPVNIDDTVTAIDKTWSSNKLSGMIKSIDDNVVSADKLWSSQKINSMLAQTGTIEDVAIASFSDGADDVPLSELIVDIEAWQEGSGEPSPDNERAIHGWNKCNIIKSNTNLWDEEWEVGVITSDGTIDNNPNYANRRTTSFIPVVPNTTYYLKCPDNALGGRYAYYNANKELVTFDGNGFLSHSIITTANVCYIRMSIGTSYGTTYNNDISINYPATDHDYHAHDGGVDTIEFGQTIFGSKLNILTGLMTVTHAIADMGELNWTYWTGNMFFSQILNKGFLAVNDMICSVLPPSLYPPTSDGIFSLGGQSQRINVYINISGYSHDASGASQIKADFVGQKIVYPLSEPVEIQLTPTEVRTLLNANNIYADTGNVDKIVYFKTGSEAVAKLIEAYMRAQPEE